MGTRQQKRDALESNLGHYVRRTIQFGPEVSALARRETRPAFVAAMNAIDDWQRDCYLALRTSLNAVDAAPDEATWDAVQIDYAPLDASIPAVTRLQDLVQL